MIVSQKIRNSAKGKQCTFRIPNVCNHDKETTVYCHGPDKTRGKSSKTNDFWGAYGCSDCHSVLDLKQIANPEVYWIQGIRETQELLIKSGLVVVAETKKKPKKTGKETINQGGLARQYGKVA